MHIFLKLALLVEYTADRCKNGGIPERKQRGKQDRSICDRRLHKPGKQSVEPIIGQGDRFAVYDRIRSGKKYGEQHRPDDTRRNGTARLFNDRRKSKEQCRIAENGQQLRRQCSDRIPIQACSRFKEDSARYKSSAPCHEAKDDGRGERGDQFRKIYRCSRVPFRINVFQRAVRMIPTHKQCGEYADDRRCIRALQRRTQHTDRRGERRSDLLSIVSGKPRDGCAEKDKRKQKDAADIKTFLPK